MSAKKDFLRLANRLVAPAGVQFYRKGLDMESALRWLAKRDHGISGIIDLGAAKGDWSRAALRLFPEAKVIGVEPLEERRSYLEALKKNHARYDYEMAVAGQDEGGTVELAVTDDLDGSSIHGSEGSKRQVPVRSIDGMVAQYNLPGPYFLKFDTHGFERPILLSAEKTLEQTRYVVMEAYNFHHTPDTLLFHEMIAFMAERGFRVTHLVDVMNRPFDGALWQVDLMFARADDPVFNSENFRR
ncbi:MAG: FkbM family methyltransferase [Erythrobacter sp.]|nr:FkbM family methyltransferase [Erythrobacter sp.]NCQ63602.1 FkbM family methyltransferase [Alphaproteobacteria bacterium]